MVHVEFLKLSHGYSVRYPDIHRTAEAVFSRLFLLFVAVPALELYLLIKVGQWIGAFETFALIVLTGLVGSAMAKAEGLAVWSRFNARLASGAVPGKELIDGLIILISGAFLITPGVLTDVVGLLGLFPPTRSLIRRAIAQRIRVYGASSASSVFFDMGASGPRRPGQPDGGSAPSPDPPSDSDTTVSGQAKQRPSYSDE